MKLITVALFKRGFFVLSAIYLISYLFPIQATNASVTDTWISLNPINRGIKNPSISKGNANIVYLNGGETTAPIRDVFSFNITTNVWNITRDMLINRSGHTSTLLNDNRMLITGGSGTTGYNNTAEIFNPTTKSWSFTATPMSSGKHLHSATLLRDGRVITVGGYLNGNTITTVEAYNATSNTWNVLTPLPVAKRGHTATLLSDGRLLIAGGAGPNKDAFIYDPDDNTWINAGQLSIIRNNSKSFLLNDGRVILIGGDTIARCTAEIWSPSTNSWLIKQPIYCREAHSAVQLVDGRLFIIGGFGNIQGGSATYLNSTEFYDPVADTWTIGPSMITPRASFAAASLNDGRVLVVAGSNLTGNLASSEIYTPSILSNLSNVWQWSDDMSPSKVPNLNNMVKVVNGKTHSLALKSDGTVWAWGSNYYGELGIDSLGGSSNFPQQVKGPNGNGFLQNVKEITAGNNFSVAVKSDGTVWIWGANWNGARGTGVGINQNTHLSTPTQVKESSTTYITNVKTVSAGDNHSLALKDDGTVYAWGNNNVGQLGIGCFLGNCSIAYFARKVDITNIKQIASGGDHNLALKDDGSVWGWGRTYEWQLGPDAYEPTIGGKLIPFQIQQLTGIQYVTANKNNNLALHTNNLISQWGNNDPTIKVINGLTNISSLSAGDSNNGLALQTNGSVWQWNSDYVPQKIDGLPFLTAIAMSKSTTPNLAVAGGDVLGDTTTSGPKPFLNLPWDYESKGLSFNDAALQINSFFDHSYPLLSSGIFEPTEFLNQVTSYTGALASDYTSHDGYDYGKAAKVNFGDSVLAAASGSASYKYSSASGNMIFINHMNGYFTRYMHLQENGLIVSQQGDVATVSAGQKIGQVGTSGHCRPKTSPEDLRCAHIHFDVYQDKDSDGNYSDNIPDGATDPFGWQPEFDDEPEKKEDDPWENYTFTHGNVQKTGNKSYYLWKNKLDVLKTSIGVNGGELVIGDKTLTFPQNAVTGPTAINLHASPQSTTEILGKKLRSIGPTLSAKAFNLVGTAVEYFFSPYVITFKFTYEKLYGVDPDTLSFYTSKDGITWKKEQTTVDLQNQKATAEIDHFSYIALMGEIEDTVPPVTQAVLAGSEGENTWYSSNVEVAFDATDNKSGVEYTLYKIGEDEWQTYDTPLLFSDEGTHEIHFYSEDFAGNSEPIKNITFTIDKTLPIVTIDANLKILWPVTGKAVKVLITGDADDENITSTTFSVHDEYNKDLSFLSAFNQTIELIAWREGTDFDGRTYTITATAKDKAGNTTSDSVEVVVPHDQAR